MKLKETLLSQKRGKAELTALILYAVGTLIIMMFHEPWLDEAQAWQIAKYAPIREIIFERPHYEGHPPFWTLLLAPFARLGAPYELTNHLINWCICVPSIAILLYKSPFPKVFRCLLPFSYMLFYQIGVINRPYNLMMLALFLAAIFYQDRNKKPVRYILALTLLCQTVAYGVLLAGGICLAWTIEILGEYIREKKFRTVFRDRRFWCLFGILMAALVLVYLCIPAEDYYNHFKYLESEKRILLFLIVLMMPFDGMFGMIISEYTIANTDTGIALTVAAGIAAWIVMILFAHANRKLTLLLCSYGLFAVFFVVVYGTVHHEAVAVLCQIFFFWVLLDDKAFKMPKLFVMIGKKIEEPFTIRLGIATCCVACCFPLACTCASSYLEIIHPYGQKELADFLIDNQLTDRSIFVQPRIYFSGMIDYRIYHGDDPNWEESEHNSTLFDETLPAIMPDVRYMETYIMHFATAVLPYMNGNVFANYNHGDKTKPYLLWKDTHDTWQDEMEIWRKEGLPDVCVGLVPIQYIFTPEELDGVKYVWVGTVHYGDIWRFEWDRTPLIIYIREDLLDEYPQFTVQHYAYNDDY